MDKPFDPNLYEVTLRGSEYALLESLRQHKDGGAIAKVLASDLKRLTEARAKHERVGENVYHALGALSAEHGEVCQELEKHREGWEDRMDSELQDVRVVALRMSLREFGEDA